MKVRVKGRKSRSGTREEQRKGSTGCTASQPSPGPQPKDKWAVGVGLGVSRGTEEWEREPRQAGPQQGHPPVVISAGTRTGTLETMVG